MISHLQGFPSSNYEGLSEVLMANIGNCLVTWMLQEIFMLPQLSMLQNLQDFVIAKIGKIQDFD